MTLDGQLLAKAQAEAARLAEAERQVRVTRADYHTMVRRLHLSGGSLREIATALGLSHQRVQQIVDGAGGSWWSRVWRTRNAERDLICSFCGRPPSEVAKLIAGPDVFICDACVARSEQTLAGSAGPGAAGRREDTKARCSFCGKRRKAGRPVVAGPPNVCADCLRICRQILDDREG